MQYLRRCGQERHWPERSDDDLEAFVLDRFLEADPAHVVALTLVEHPADPPSMIEACRRVEEWRMVEWARHQVLVPRVAPSSGQLLQRYDDSRLALPYGVRPPHRGVTSDSAARSWLSRLRRRWRGRYGRMRVCDELPLATMSEKARARDS